MIQLKTLGVFMKNCIAVANLKRICFLAVLAALIFSGCLKKSYTYRNIETETACADKGGYWYNGRCWKGFEDSQLIAEEVDAYVALAMREAGNAIMEINGISYPVVYANAYPLSGREVEIVAVYQTDSQIATIAIQMRIKNLEEGKTSKASAMYIDHDVSKPHDENMEFVVAPGTAQALVISIESLQIAFQGNIPAAPGTEELNFKFKLTDSLTGMGNSNLTVEGTQAHLSGTLGTKTYAQIQSLIANHPEVDTIVFGHINGSINDEVNMHTGRLIREQGYTTKLLSDSDIASGGVDLFCSGVERIVEQGAKIGVHSWCCVENVPAESVPADHPAHQYQLAYFT
ncbi:MAG: hypothetical protein B0D92_00465, partial [Spirochaeta sp. LUC14_002_19_P3]